MRMVGRAAVAAVLLLGGCAGQAANPDALADVYQRSIAAAAVKRPDYARPLQPIDASRPEVRVAHIQPYPTIDTSRFVWVTQPEELRALCSGRPDPLLALQEALGLPPQARSDVRVFTFDVRPADLFRPCASGPAVTTTQCRLDLPAKPVPADAATEHFVLAQMMSSYRSGFEGPGYPFTAMGWSYDWDPNSPTHRGVSEYVMKRGAVIHDVTSVDPATFCRAPQTSELIAPPPPGRRGGRSG